MLERHRDAGSRLVRRGRVARSDLLGINLPLPAGTLSQRPSYVGGIVGEVAVIPAVEILPRDARSPQREAEEVIGLLARHRRLEADDRSVLRIPRDDVRTVEPARVDDGRGPNAVGCDLEDLSVRAQPRVRRHFNGWEGTCL